MTLKGGGTKQACAACKFQRRKCTPECVLAPYFPADQRKAFQNVHKLFGVSNIEKILKILDPSLKKIAMDSIICQANYRDKYPVHGCCEVICRLRYQIWYVEQELRAVHRQLEIYRQLFLQQLALPAVSEQHSYCNSNGAVGYNSMDVESKDHVVRPNSLRVQNPCQDDDGDSMAMAMHSQLQLGDSLQPLDMQQKVVGSEYYDEMSPLFSCDRW